MKFSINDFFSKCDQIRRKRMWNLRMMRCFYSEILVGKIIQFQQFLLPIRLFQYRFWVIATLFIPNLFLPIQILGVTSFQIFSCGIYW